jgi:hypothetical protein
MRVYFGTLGPLEEHLLKLDEDMFSSLTLLHRLGN